jgi:hypothetical protein
MKPSSSCRRWPALGRDDFVQERQNRQDELGCDASRCRGSWGDPHKHTRNDAKIAAAPGNRARLLLVLELDDRCWRQAGGHHAMSIKGEAGVFARYEAAFPSRRLHQFEKRFVAACLVPVHERRRGTTSQTAESSGCPPPSSSTVSLRPRAIAISINANRSKRSFQCINGGLSPKAAS